MKNIMKRISAVLLLCILVVVTFPQMAYGAVENGAVYTIETNSISGWPQMGELNSETACLMDADTGAVLVNKGMDNQRFPASITKVMTVLLALENSNLSDQVTFTAEGLARMAEGTNIASQVSEVLTMEQCLYIIMIVSANEVAAQVAIQLAGSEAAFAEMMNARAAELGCTNTHFTNASGLPDDNHYTTAHDMALIFQAALQNEEFVKIIETRDYTLPATNMNPQPRGYHTHLALVSAVAPEYYPDCIGGKTGVTQVAQHTLVTAARKDKKTLIAVVMRAVDAGKTCADTTAMYEYGFRNFTKMELGGGSAMVPNGVTRDQLLTEDREGQSLVDYYFGTQYVGMSTGTSLEEDAESTEEAEGSEPEQGEKQPQTVSEDFQSNDNPLLQYKEFAATAGAVAGLLILVILMSILRLITKKR